METASDIGWKKDSSEAIMQILPKGVEMIN